MAEEDWQQELRHAFRDPHDLAKLLNIPLASLPSLPETQHFPFLVPQSFAKRMTQGDPCDPLLLQVWPDAREGILHEGERLDPVGDTAARCEAGLLHKYRGRMLLVATGACALHCRYCFRQNYPYRDDREEGTAWDAALERLRAETTVSEVLLSGGDPLALPDAALERLVRSLDAIPHIETLRIHTRLPVAVPSRIQDGFCQILRGTRLKTVMVLHANHAAELDTAVREACARLREAGATLLNQSVLLAGVNDAPKVLERLSRALWQAGVLPYYLHALDPVRGARRFFVPDAHAVALLAELRKLLPGYLVPRLVREIEGEASKTPLT